MFCENSLFCHTFNNIRIPFYNGEFLLPIPVKNLGMEKKLHNNLPIKNGLFSSTDFLLGDFSMLCLVPHLEKMNMQLKSSLTVIITKSFSAGLAWKKPGLWFSY